MRDALGTVQSVLVLGGTSEIALATVRRPRGRPVPHGGARRPRPRGRRRRRRRAPATPEPTTVDVVAFDASRTGRPTWRSSTTCFDRFDDLDLVISAFGVLGDQGASTTTRPPPPEPSAVNYGGAVIERPRGRRATPPPGPRHPARPVVGRRRAGPTRTTTSTARRKPASTPSPRDSATRSSARGPARVVVRPGFVHTKMTADMDAAPFSTTPDAVAAAIVAGLAKGHETIWAPPILRWVFGVLSHLPRPLWRIVSKR